MQQEENKRKIWQRPWGYPESTATTIGIVIVGFVLQITMGEFDFFLLASPVNWVVGVLLVGFCLLTLVFKRSELGRWFTGIPLSVCLIVTLLVLAITMGLTPQNTPGSTADTDFFTPLGFNSMTRSWAFVLIYFTTLLSLGSLIVRRVLPFKITAYGFYVNHIGLWLVLFASGLGSADMKRYVMHVRTGEIEWRVYDDQKHVEELPIAIQLNHFDMEEYPPKLTIIDRKTGEAQPQIEPDFYQIDTTTTKGELNGWGLQMEEYIHQAIRNSDSTYREVPMPGATPAARVTMQNTATGEIRQGWVCGGNQAQLYMTLELNEQYAVVMTVPEPKRFVSDIEVFAQNGTSKKAQLEVNHPLRLGSWSVYQYGYDNAAGRLSSYSSFELAYDPWLIPVYIGFLMIAIGAFAMIGKGKSQINRHNSSTTN